MPRMLELFCLVLEQEPSVNKIFRVVIADTASIGTLKEKIKEKKQLTFKDIEANAMKLWNVSIPAQDLSDVDIPNILPKRHPLLPMEILEDLFPDTPTARHLHIIVQPPAPLLVLNCLVLGESRDDVFPVEIFPTKSVESLKKAIKQETSHLFNHIDAKALPLWKVSEVIDLSFEERLQTANFSAKKSLSSYENLSKIFSDPPIKGHLHIVVGQPTKVPNPVSVILEDGEQEDLARPLKKARIDEGALWRYPEEPEWKEFHRDWWGAPGKDRLNKALSDKVLRITQPLVRQSFGLLHLTDGALYLRTEVIQTYHDLAGVCNLQQSEGSLNGVLLTGQPGLGKSTGIIHIITQRMALEQHTLFTSSQNEVFWICKDGVQRCSWPAQFILPAHLTLFNSSSHPWSVIDACHRNRLPPSTALFGSRFFTVYATSPNLTQYKDWLKESEPRVYVMQPWNWEEEDLLKCMNFFSNFKMNNLSNSTAEIYRYCGPLPRDIWSYLRDPEVFIRKVQVAAAALTADTIQTILRRMQDLTVSDLDLASHNLIIRRLDRDPTYSKHDTYEVDFKSPFVEEELRKRFAELALQNAERLFCACSLVPETSVFGGWIFEAQAMKYTAGQISNNSAFGPFKKMKADDRRFTDETLSEGPNRYRVEKDDRGILTCYNGSSHVLRYTPSDFSRPMSSMDDRQPGLFHKREFLHYPDINLVEIHPKHYYVPVESNNPLFNAFFFDYSVKKRKEQNKQVFIYIVQMAVAKRHGGSKSGLALVQILKRRVQESVGKEIEVKVRYLLIAPARTYAVSWLMPAEWDDLQYQDIKGEVYIQYMDMRVMKG